MAVALLGSLADHHGVNDPHAHPAHFRKDQRQSKPQCGRKFSAKCV